MRSLQTLIFTLACWTGVANAGDVLYATGEAFSVGQDTPVYTENHTINMQTHTQRVEYLDPSGRAFVRKWVEYHSRGELPSFRQNDLRTRDSFGSYWQGSQLVMFRTDTHNRTEKKSLAEESNLVLDVGFDHFIRKHWEQILARQKVTMDFAHPYYLQVFALDVSEESPAESPIATKNPQWVYLRARPANLLVRFFANTLHVAYDRQERRLMVFQGVSNIPDSRGNPQMVSIHYRYYAPQPAAAQALPPDAKGT